MTIEKDISALMDLPVRTFTEMAKMKRADSTTDANAGCLSGREDVHAHVPSRLAHGGREPGGAPDTP